MKFFASLSKKMKSGGVLLLGENEELPETGEWSQKVVGTVKAYIKK